jgi:hypothetical protein
LTETPMPTPNSARAAGRLSNGIASNAANTKPRNLKACFMGILLFCRKCFDASVYFPVVRIATALCILLEHETDWLVAQKLVSHHPFVLCLSVIINLAPVIFW